MTSYGTNVMLGAAAPFKADDKGSFGNRVDCATAQVKNNATAALQATVVTGASIGTAYLAKVKAPVVNKAASYLGKVLSKAGSIIATPLKKAVAFAGKTKVGAKAGQVLSKIGKTPVVETIAKAFSKVGKAAAKNPAAAVSVAALTVGAMALSYISHNHAYKAGQIDQKYTDRARTQPLNR